MSITVPTFGDSEDERYLGLVHLGSQFIGGGQIFNVDEINFISQYNNKGFPNRTKIPNLTTIINS